MQCRDDRRKYSEYHKDDEHLVNSYGFVETYDRPSDIVMSRGIRHMKDTFVNKAAQNSKNSEIFKTQLILI